MTVSLAYVPTHDVVNLFSGVIGPLVDALGDQDELSDDAISWFDYFERTYIGQEKRFGSILLLQNIHFGVNYCHTNRASQSLCLSVCLSDIFSSQTMQ